MPEALDDLNQAIADAIVKSGVAFVMTTRIRGRVALRLSICSHRTLEDDIDLTFEAIAREGRRLAPSLLSAVPAATQEKAC
jgi:aromatic-L-amino-acid/L-tryptophan decarboxylase